MPLLLHTRRALLAGAGLIAARCGSRPKEPPPRPLRTSAVVLLRDAVGSGAQTLGMLRLLHQFVREARVILWPDTLDGGIEEVLLREFPKLRIAAGAGDSTPVQAALQEAEFLLHGCGPSLIWHSEIDAWRREKKPYGIFGITLTAQDVADRRNLLDGAAFVFAAEKASLDVLKQARVTAPQIAFAPDSTFSLKAADAPFGAAFLKKEQLKSKKFIVVAADSDPKLSEATARWSQDKGHKVISVSRDWPVLDAASIYRRATAVVGTENQALRTAAAAGTPVIFLHRSQDGTAGQIWKDVGLTRWYIELEQAGADDIAARLTEIYNDYAAAQVEVHEAVLYARKLQGDAMITARRAILS